jgi:hypothetical protein
MEKIVEALSKLLPEEQVAEVAEAVQGELETAKEAMEQEYSDKLQEAYKEFSEELKQAEQTGEEGYSEALAMIKELRGRLDTQAKEFKVAMDEGYEEAFQMLEAEKAKNENLDVEMYEEFNKKLQEMREYFIDKIHQFLEYKGPEIAESVRRDLMNDPRLVENRVVLDKIVENVSDYLDADQYNAVANAKLDEAQQAIEDLRSQVKILESRNIRLGTENGKLNEAVRQQEQLLTEANEAAAQDDKQERQQKAKNATGRGRVAEEGIIREHQEEVPEDDDDSDKTLVESLDPDMLAQMQVLAGTKEDE